jgi:hypothetical protein
MSGCDALTERKRALGTHRFQRAVSAKYAFIGTIPGHASPRVRGRLIPISRSFAETARWKRCILRGFPQECLL